MLLGLQHMGAVAVLGGPVSMGSRSLWSPSRCKDVALGVPRVAPGRAGSDVLQDVLTRTSPSTAGC